MDTKYYVCQADFGAEGCPNDMTGKAMTIGAWKNWAIRTKLDDLFGVGLIFDNNAMVDIVNMATLEEEKAIEYIRDYFDMRIIPLEDGCKDDCKRYIDCDNHYKLITENDVRTLCLQMEQNDLFDNFNDYKDGTLRLESHLNWVKECVNGDINTLLDELNNYGLKVVKIEIGAF